MSKLKRTQGVRMKTISVLLFSALLLAACSNPVVDLKSPCVGGKDSPCDKRPPINQNMV